ncbi:phosphotransferase [Gemmatimonadota bacterium Y43]|uniref:phosphotransferase n=1 Tax=Gaopeijia maritima TaxID=3119007 RepID=UPI0032852932
MTRGGALAGIIDWGDVSGGDPAVDLASAWTILRSESERKGFWKRYGASEAERCRARAWAVFFALGPDLRRRRRSSYPRCPHRRRGRRRLTAGRRQMRIAGPRRLWREPLPRR